MQISYLFVWASQAAAIASAAAVPRSASSDQDKLNELANAAYEQTQRAASARNSQCKWTDIRVRKEWGSLSAQERKDYIAAVKCLQSKPARTPQDLVPGAKTRFDDFVATHVNQTGTIHYTGNFLSWHRYYTWLYEEALRKECGYRGTQPYWDWAKTAVTGLEKSPIFDGSDTSMSGNGEFVPSEGDIILGASNGLPPVYLPTGTGGGCVKSGPFKDMVVNLGPVALDLPGGNSASNPNGPFAHNPRCLKRDLTDAVNRAYANATSIVQLITQNNDIANFQQHMQGAPGSGSIGVHGGGHYSIGGDPGRDVYISPGDPIFYLHHATIDRTWWIWQTMDPSQRMQGDSAISGTRTFFNSPPSPDTTLDDLLDYGFAAGPALPIKDTLSTIRGPFCYVYR